MSDDKPTLYERLMDDAGKGIAPARPAVVMSRLPHPGLKWWVIFSDGSSGHGLDREFLLTQAAAGQSRPMPAVPRD